MANQTQTKTLEPVKAQAIGACISEATSKKIQAEKTGQDVQAAYQAAYTACMKRNGYPQGR